MIILNTEQLDMKLRNKIEKIHKIVSVTLIVLSTFLFLIKLWAQDELSSKISGFFIFYLLFFLAHNNLIIKKKKAAIAMFIYCAGLLMSIAIANKNFTWNVTYYQVIGALLFGIFSSIAYSNILIKTK